MTKKEMTAALRPAAPVEPPPQEERGTGKLTDLANRMGKGFFGGKREG